MIVIEMTVTMPTAAPATAPAIAPTLLLSGGAVVLSGGAVVPSEGAVVLSGEAVLLSGGAAWVAGDVIHSMNRILINHKSLAQGYEAIFCHILHTSVKIDFGFWTVWNTVDGVHTFIHSLLPLHICVLPMNNIFAIL